MFNKLGTKIALQKAGLGNVSLPKTDGLFGGGNAKSADANGAGGGNGGFANPFSNVEWGMPKVFASWSTPSAPQTSVREAPHAGERAQTSTKLRFPAEDGRPRVVLFLRFCGCPCE